MAFTIVFLFYLTVLAIWDIRNKEVPFIALVIGGTILCIYLMTSAACSEKGVAEMMRIVLGLIPGILFLLMAFGTKKAGYADGIIIMMIGATESYLGAILSVSIGSLIMAIVAGTLLAMGKVKKNTKLPFLPSLAIGYAVFVIASGKTNFLSAL